MNINIFKRTHKRKFIECVIITLNNLFIMALKSIYTILEFANQIEYANHMLKSIYDEDIKDIVFNGNKEDFLNSKLKFRCFDHKAKDPSLMKLYENCNKYLIVKSQGKWKNKQK